MTPILLLLLSTLILCTSSEDSTYTTKFDDVNLEEILASQRLLTGYVNCLLDKGPCTPDGKELKKTLPDAILSDCSKCTQRQREGSDQVMGFIIDHRPEDWAELEKKYSSDGNYKRKYLERKAVADNKGNSGENENFKKDQENEADKEKI